MIGVYVDDIVLAGESDKLDIKDLSYFLGIKIVQNKDTGDVWMGQPAYIETVLKKFGMEEAKAISTPVNPSNKTSESNR